MNEFEMKLIHLHKRENSRTFVPRSTPIPPEFLDSSCNTILEIKDDKKEGKEIDCNANIIN